ncbi:MAG: hypothetical protein JWR19_824 [Pedosphaera sp.]|nr:hypothetical protein [Pedosphaera sp.]
MKTETITINEPVVEANQCGIMAEAIKCEPASGTDPIHSVLISGHELEQVKNDPAFPSDQTPEEVLPPRRICYKRAPDVGEPEDSLGQTQTEEGNEPSGLSLLFKKFRRFKRTPPIEDVILRFVAEGRQKEEAEQLVAMLCAVFGRALELCEGDRQAAAVLAAIESRARGGKRFHNAYQIAEITRQKNTVIAHYLERLLKQGVLDRSPIHSARHGTHELVSPIQPQLSEKSMGPYADPIDYLRLSNGELKALSAKDSKQLMVRAILSAATERLALQESVIRSKIAENQATMESTRQQIEESKTCLGNQMDENSELKTKLSSIYWAKRHPLGLEVAPEPQVQIPPNWARAGGPPGIESRLGNALTLREEIRRRCAALAGRV